MHVNSAINVHTIHTVVIVSRMQDMLQVAFRPHLAAEDLNKANQAPDDKSGHNQYEVVVLMPHSRLVLCCDS